MFGQTEVCLRQSSKTSDCDHPLTHSKILAALANPTRRDIYEAIRAQPRSVAALAEGKSVSRPAISQHLKVLVLASLVTARVEGSRRVYAGRPDGLAPLTTWLQGLERVDGDASGPAD